MASRASSVGERSTFYGRAFHLLDPAQPDHPAVHSDTVTGFWEEATVKIPPWPRRHGALGVLADQAAIAVDIAQRTHAAWRAMGREGV
jgi:hypothetical protein